MLIGYKYVCVIHGSVREWDEAVAMLTPGKICTADVTKEIQSSFPGAAVNFHLLLCFISSSPLCCSLSHVRWLVFFLFEQTTHIAVVFGSQPVRERNPFHRNNDDADQRPIISHLF